MTTIQDDILTDKEVAAMVGMSLAWVRRMRWIGGGIPYIKYDRGVRYHRSDVEAFMEQRKQENTSCNKEVDNGL